MKTINRDGIAAGMMLLNSLLGLLVLRGSCGKGRLGGGRFEISDKFQISDDLKFEILDL